MRIIKNARLLIPLLVLFGAGLSAQTQAASTAYLIYRVYLPDGGVSKVTLPTLTFSYSDGRAAKTVKPCDGSSVQGGSVPSCAWSTRTGGGGTGQASNGAYPDTSAIYWTTQFDADPALAITIKGQYPDARYMSFNVYDAALSSFKRNGVTSGLPDYLIAPDAGSLNPFQQSAVAGGGFTLRLSPYAAQGESNVLPMPQATNAAAPGLPAPCSGSACDPLNRFVRAPSSRLYANVDMAYLSALTQPKSGQVLVIRGKVPTSVVGAQAMHPTPWPAADLQTRYWSICNNIYVLPYPVTSCIPDYKLVTDAQGYYTVVASSVTDKPSNATAANGVSWLQNSPLLPRARHMLIVRNMLPNQFDQAIQNVPVGSGPDVAASVVKEYYPRIWSCSKATFQRGGWQACVQ